MSRSGPILAQWTLDRDGASYALQSVWGINHYRRFGAPSLTTNELVSVPEPALTGSGTALDSIVDVGVGYAHFCALRANGEVWCAGFRPSYSSDVNYGDGQLVLTNDQARELVVGSHANYARLADGSELAWGRNSSGAIGDGTFVHRYPPVQVSGVTGAVALTASQRRACALQEDGRALCWGEISNSLSAEAIELPPVPLSKVNLGKGQLGDGTSAWSPHPVPVPFVAGASHVTVGGDFSCMLLTNPGSNGNAFCWGDNTLGTLGVEPHVRGESRRNRVVLGRGRCGLDPAGPALTGAVEVFVSHQQFACARRGDGSVACWGLLPWDQGPLSFRAVELGSGVDASRLSGGVGALCLVDASGWLWCRGDNGAGELGLGYVSASWNPKEVPIE